ncbi:MAG: Do family serine endopeptidase [Candidatus Omnitrophica bacterium]|nr:Do family serine endopeptidase [Candidatus Omnitrophota bacterium]
MKTGKIFFGIAFLLIGLAIGLFAAVKLYAANPVQPQSKSVQAAPASAGVSSFEGFKMEDAVINVAATAGKAVVSISTEHTSKIPQSKSYYFNSPSGQGSPFGEEEPFRKFFEDFFGEMPNREYRQMGLGSGVVIDPDGYILTNQHVIEQADKITVTLPDGREFKGEIKGQDMRSDLAIIKINARNLPVAKLGDSDNLKIGQWVVAIGNPFGYALQNPEPTVTAGVISALHRSLGRAASQDKDYNDLIQTDAAINPGNSGGPLVNLRGEIVGINVAIFSTSGGYQGIGFAIPINSAKRIISKLIEGKKIVYGWLGVTVQDLTEDLARYFGLPNKYGVLVAKIMKDSPAEKGGIKDGDVIIRFDNKTVNNVRELLNIVGKAEIGRKVKVTVIRDKKEADFEVAITERPKEIEESGLTQEAGIWRGLKVDDLSPVYAGRFKIEEKEGVVVLDVDPGSPADAAGIMPGDVILEINKQKVKNLSDYQKITAGLKGNVLVRAARGFFIVKEVEE